jgi:carbonic anhydrase
LRVRRQLGWGVVAVVALGGVLLLASQRAQFILGGALVNAGLRMQDHLHTYDFEHEAKALTAPQVWDEFQRQNALSASVRHAFPRSTEHPAVALLVCMDARLDTSELAGDTRRYYDVVRTAGSVRGPQEQEMLELAVVHGVKLLVLTRHTDCAAERVAADPEKRLAFPALAAAVDEREQRIAELLARPPIAERIALGELLVKQLVIDTSADELVTHVPHASAATHPGH